MNENVENLILLQLREIRAELELGAGGERMSAKLDDVADNQNGFSMLLTALASYVQGLDGRSDRLESRQEKS